MKFNVTLGNPPYQEMIGGGTYTEGARPLYNEFIDKCNKISNLLCMIIPSRWMCGGRAVLNSFRDHVVENRNIKVVVNYNNSKEVFGNVAISGGIQYLLFNNLEKIDDVEIINIKNGASNIEKRRLYEHCYYDSNRNIQYMIVIDNILNDIIDKATLDSNTLDKNVISSFGFGTDYLGNKDKTYNDDVKLVSSNGRETYVERNGVINNYQYIDKYKVCLIRLTAEGASYTGGLRRVIGTPFILKHGEVISDTYVVVSCFETLKECENMIKYLETKLVRSLILSTLTSMHI